MIRRNLEVRPLEPGADLREYSRKQTVAPIKALLWERRQKSESLTADRPVV
jgi:hypothetical protein